MTRRSRAAWAALAILAGAAPLRAQVCSGHPFRDDGAVAATYLSGDAADVPLSIRQFGGAAAWQLPGRTPLGGRHALRAEAAAGDATEILPADPQGGGRARGAEGDHAAVAAAYALDLLPDSYLGDYALCLTVGAAAARWEIRGRTGHAVEFPASLSFGVDLRWGRLGFYPHGGFGAYWHDARGEVAGLPVRSRGVRPWGEAGIGVTAAPFHLGAALRHELKAEQRVRIALAWEF